jgi:cell fate (sporulation/competence/biofilm development) regulator YlbF (YheA/YmcA/DUF963 family)
MEINDKRWVGGFHLEENQTSSDASHRYFGRLSHATRIQVVSELYRIEGVGMDSVHEALDRLIKEVIVSKEYNEYLREKERVKKYPELKNRLDEFRRKNFQMQNGDDRALEMLDQMEQEYERLMENPVVSGFLSSELAFCRLMQDISMSLAGSIDFE